MIEDLGLTAAARFWFQFGIHAWHIFMAILWTDLVSTYMIMNESHLSGLRGTHHLGEKRLE